jgi:hypothetical protein
MARVVTAAVVLAVSLSAATASAQPRPAGAVTAHGVIGTAVRLDGSGQDGIWGGGVIADVSAPFDAFRLGGAIGVTAVTSDADDASRVLMPVALSLGVVLRTSPLWVELRGRGGIWAGATNQGLAVGAFFSAGALLALEIGAHVALGVSADAFFMLGHGDAFAFVPGIAITWSPAPETPSEEEP